MNPPAPKNSQEHPRRPRWALILACGIAGVGLGLGRAYYEHGQLTGIDIGAAAGTIVILVVILVLYARRNR